MPTRPQPKGGSRKGVPNKSTAAVKEALAFAYQGIGGHERFRDWAAENPTEFYKLYSKQLPLEHSGSVGMEWVVNMGKSFGRL